jgi:hypothetical protein
MDDLYLSLSECSPSDLPRTLGPYLRDRVRCRSPDGLELFAYPGPIFFYIQAGDAHEGDDSTGAERFAMVEGKMSVTLDKEEADKLCFDIIAHISQEIVVDLTTTLPILRSEELCIQMRNLTRLHLEGVDLSTWFVEPGIREPHIFKDLLPGLRSISITNSSLSGGDWGPFTNFLTRRTAIGNRISSLRLCGYPHMDEDVVESIKGAVNDFEDEGSNGDECSCEDEGSDEGEGSDEDVVGDEDEGSDESEGSDEDDY